MTSNELSSLFYLDIELKRIKKYISELKEKLSKLTLENTIGEIVMDGLPHGNSPGMPTENAVINLYSLQEDIKNQLNEQLEYYLEKQLEYEKIKAAIEEYIDTIPDAELRSIFKYRCIEHMNWSEVGKILSMDRTTASRKYYDYINSQKN